MVKASETESKVTAAKKTITVKNVCIKNGILVDEYGDDVIPQIDQHIPDCINTFSFKITLELPEEE